MRTSALLAGASLLAGLAGCTGAPSPPGARPTPAACAASDALWVASDNETSGVGALGVDAGVLSSTVGAVDLGSDPALATSRGRAFFVAELTDTVFELDPRCGTPTTRFSAHLPGQTGSSDPQDVAVASDGSLWIPLYLGAAILVLAPGGSVRTTIDLSSYDADGNPDAAAIAIVDTPAGEKAFVPVQRLDPYPQSTQPSWMLRVDVATAKVEATIVLAGRNPFGMIADGAALWLSEPGNFDDAAEPLAGIERFDTATSTTALVAREADLGGSVAEVAVSGSCGAAIVADPTTANVTSLVTFDATTGAVLVPASRSPLVTGGASGGFDLEAVAWLGGTLEVGDRRRGANGYPLHAFTASSTCALAGAPTTLELPLPPVALRVP